MNKLLLGGVAVATIAAAGVAFAQVAPQAAPPAPRAKAMKVQTRADIQARVARQFARLDTNRDGIVTKAEADALQAQRAVKIQEREQKRAERRAQRDPAKIFARLDANNDGRITQAEAEAARTARAKGKGREPAKAHAVAFGGLFNRADANKDGVITRAEFDASPKPLPGRRQAGMRRGAGGRLFETADANKDGRVSLAEAQSVALQRFDRLDLNRDGTLTREERRQAREQLRTQRKPS